jgi:putative photosynthetic complex assembly protein
MQAATPDIIPRRALLAGGLALIVLVGAIGAARLTGVEITEPDAVTVIERSLRFVDRPDGGIAVLDARSGRTLDVMQGEQGFLRGTLRGMARERRRNGLDDTAALSLLARADGRLTLVDPATGRRIDLESFGPTNAAVFARWIAPPTAQEARP